MNNPNRRQLAQVVADAYFSQYGPEERQSHVMNNPAIIYDSGTFSWCSSLTPDDEGEIRVDELEEGAFGNFDANEPGAEKALIDYIANDADDYWDSIVERIQEA